MEATGDLIMKSLGFDSYHFSQSRATMQTPGIPDRKYFSRERRAAVWWEAKTAIGHPSAFQVAFRANCEACGEEYVLGTDDALVDWAVSKGFAERLPNGLRVIR